MATAFFKMSRSQVTSDDKGFSFLSSSSTDFSLHLPGNESFGSSLYYLSKRYTSPGSTQKSNANSFTFLSPRFIRVTVRRLTYLSNTLRFLISILLPPFLVDSFIIKLDLFLFTLGGIDQFVILLPNYFFFYKLMVEKHVSLRTQKFL